MLGIATLDECFRCRHLGHGSLMVEALFSTLERSAAEEDRSTFLNGRHTTGGKAAAVADGIDLIHHRAVGVAGPQKIAMLGVWAALVRHRARRCGERLAQYLAPIQLRKAQILALAAK